MAKPWGYVTNSGKVLSGDVIDKYVTKQDSLQLPAQEVFSGENALLVPRWDPLHLAGLLEQSTPHLVACRQKAEDVIGHGWDLVTEESDADSQARREVLQWLTQVPRPGQALYTTSVRDALVAAQFDYEAMGRGVLELVREERRPDGRVEMLVHVPAQTIRLHQDSVRMVQWRGGRRRWFKWAGADVDVDAFTGDVAELGTVDPQRRANEIIWWRNYHPMDPVYGAPDVIPAIGAIVGDIGRRDFNIEFFQNFGIPAWAVFVTGDFDPGQYVDEDGNIVDKDSSEAVMTETEWQIEKLLQHVRKNPHSNLVFTVPTRDNVDDGKVEIRFERLSTESKEASFRMYRRDNREEVLSSHRMSAAIAGVFDQGTANREARSQYRNAVLLPRRGQIEGVINHYVISTMAPQWRLTLTPDTETDSERLMEAADKAVSAGAISPREYRRVVAPILGLSPVVSRDSDHPALDGHYVDGNRVDADTQGDDGQSGQLAGMRDDLVALAAKAYGIDLDGQGS